MAKHKRNKLRVYVHFVWATWDRLPLITEDIERAVHRYIESICCDNKCDVFAVGGMPDHVHLLVAMPATISLSELMQRVKGGSSRYITAECKQGEWFAWQGSYGAFSLRRKDLDDVIAYISNQKQRHTAQKLWPDAEATFEEADTT